MARDRKSQVEQLGGIGIFVRAGEARSFTAAARSLGISASGVSRAIARLESRLGTQLVNRTTRSLSLTAEGQAYLERCKRALGELADAEEALRHSHDDPEGPLRVRLPKSFGRAVVIPALAEFTRRYPRIALDVHLASGVTDMVEQGTDVAMQLGRPRDARLVARRLCGINYVLCASPDYLREHGTPRRIADLDHHRCLAYIQPINHHYRDWVLNDNGTQVTHPVKGALNIDDMHAVLDAAIAGAGIAYVMDFVIRGPLAERKLKIVLPRSAHAGPPAYIVAPPQRYRLRRVQAFIDFLFELAQRPPA
jgi:LysR family transcriptional regulator, regulator for bpeEF and oprC